MKIDLRSDTVTRPSQAMIKAMMNADTGDDVFGDDPSVNHLETKAAEMFGMESALFCPSGTMTNQLAIRVHCEPGSEVICERNSHIYQYEGGGVALNAFSSVKLLEGNRGRIKAEQIHDAVNNPGDIHKAVSRLVSLENTMNKGGGSIYDFQEFKKIREVCDEYGLKLHLDGARLFNALVETREKPSDYGELFDSISICLSKGLGCPVGSLLLGNSEDIKKARRFRKVMGGGWRQAGILAAAGIFALEHNIYRLKQDHERALKIGLLFAGREDVKNVFPIETNIVILELVNNRLATEFVAEMAEMDVLCVPFGKHLVRFVTHLDFTDEMLGELEKRVGN